MPQDNPGKSYHANHLYRRTRQRAGISFKRLDAHILTLVTWWAGTARLLGSGVRSGSRSALSAVGQRAFLGAWGEREPNDLQPMPRPARAISRTGSTNPGK